MIRSFAHRGLEKLYYHGNIAGLPATHIKKLRRMLTVLDETQDIRQLQGLWRCHQLLQGNRYPQWSLTVSRNWRLTFELRDGDVYIVNYEDYH